MASGALGATLLLTLAGLTCPGTLCAGDLVDATGEKAPEAPGVPEAASAVDVLRDLVLELDAPVLTELLAAHLPGPGDQASVGHGPAAPEAPGHPEVGSPSSNASMPAAPGGELRVLHVAPPAPDHRRAQGVASAHAAPAPTGPGQGQATVLEQAARALPYVLGALFVGLYHRLNKREVLEHEARERILELLSQRPGLGTSEVARALGCCYRTARHHLEMLERFDLVVATRTQAAHRWALPMDAGELRTRLTAQQSKVLGLLSQEPGLHLSAVAQRLGVAKSTAKLHLDALIERGLLREERLGPLRCFQPTSETQEARGEAYE